jgi:hypothetical protein
MEGAKAFTSLEVAPNNYRGSGIKQQKLERGSLDGGRRAVHPLLGCV